LKSECKNKLENSSFIFKKCI